MVFNTGNTSVALLYFPENVPPAPVNITLFPSDFEIHINWTMLRDETNAPDYYTLWLVQQRVISPAYYYLRTKRTIILINFSYKAITLNFNTKKTF